MTIYSELSDKLMQFYTDGEFKSEAIQAQQQFYEMAGVFDEASMNFELKLAQFSDWYLFTRHLTRYGLPPVGLQKEMNLCSLSEDEERLAINLANNRHSLFAFIKMVGDDLHVRDLFSDYKMIIKKSPVTYGFEAKEFFEGRLIPHNDSFIFSTAFCFHPAEAGKYIQQEIKVVNKAPAVELPQKREELILRLFKMRQKYDQYKHVQINDIYSNEPRMKF